MPEIEPQHADVYDAFLALSNHRAAGFDANPISWSDLAAYLTLHEIDRETRSEWIPIIRALDAAWMKWRAQKQNAGRS